MNLRDRIVQWPKHYKPIPKPFSVTRCDSHFLVCILDDNGNLIEEVSMIHWDKYVVRKWAFAFAKVYKK